MSIANLVSLFEQKEKANKLIIYCEEKKKKFFNNFFI